MAMTDPAGQAGAPRYASRKFVLTALVLAEAGAFAAFHVIDPATWAAITGGVLAAYITGNVAQRASIQ